MHFFQMWDLVRRNYGHIPSGPRASFMKVVTPELLMAIFFEESGFRNIRQNEFDHNDWLKRWSMPVTKKHNPNGNHAVGFGQVERESIVALRALGRTFQWRRGRLPR